MNHKGDTTYSSTLGGIITLLFSLFILAYGSIIVLKTLRKEHYNLESTEEPLADFALSVKDLNQALVQTMQLNVYLTDGVGTLDCTQLSITYLMNNPNSDPKWVPVGTESPFIKGNSSRECKFELATQSSLLTSLLAQY
jgi:hypothetical protein